MICTALVIYCAGIISLALWPTSDITLVEIICAGLAGISIIGLLAHMTDAVYLPGEELAYLVTGMVGATVFGIYIIHTSDTNWEQARLGLLLASGSITGYGAFMAEGRYGDRDG